MRGLPMDKYTDFTLPNQPTKPYRSINPPWLKYGEDSSSPPSIDIVLRILLNRMLLNAAPPAETWKKILTIARTGNHAGLR